MGLQNRKEQQEAENIRYKELATYLLEHGEETSAIEKLRDWTKSCLFSHDVVSPESTTASAWNVHDIVNAMPSISSINLESFAAVDKCTVLEPESTIKCFLMYMIEAMMASLAILASVEANSKHQFESFVVYKKTELAVL